ncbi:hypothetical protein [Streptomyces sp. NBC_00670]|uniref:hypothetical protein n=1 Tax=Streptomyces sp. NBC_00670 TaxID=2975804 RepID=UPI002E37D7E5|nr:hypothetical protein [Streptomyces sp. NBC_00670]
MNGDWLLRGRDGRLSVYQLSDDSVLCRAETVPSGTWDAPRRVGGDQKLHRVLAVGQGDDRYAHLVSWRPTVRGESGLVHSTHFRPALAALDWTPIGHPNKNGKVTGVPAVAVDAQGRAHVFVRNKGGGLSMVAQKEKGGWDPWRDLKGRELHDDLVAVTTRAGLVEAYGTVPGGIVCWRQPKAGARPVPDDSLRIPVRPGTLRALATSDEHVTVFFGDEHGNLCAWRSGGKPRVLLPAVGPGPVAAVGCELDGHPCTLLAQRAAGSGRVAFAAYPAEEESAGAWWTESGDAVGADAEVALAEDEAGRVVAATLSPATGELRVTRRKAEAGLALEAWRTF